MVALVAMCCLATVGCSEKSKKVVTPLHGNIMLIDYDDGFFGLSIADGTPLVNSEVFDSVSWNEDLGLIVTWESEKDETSLITAEGAKVLTDKVTGITPIDGGFCKVTTADKQVYMVAGKKSDISGVWGKFSDIEVEENYMFFRNPEGLWGATRISPNQGLAPRNYTNIYIVRNEKKTALLVKSAVKGWQLFDDKGVGEGVSYPLNSTQLERKLEKVKLPNAPYGIVEVKWNL